MDRHLIQGEVEILLFVQARKTRDKRRPRVTCSVYMHTEVTLDYVKGLDWKSLARF